MEQCEKPKNGKLYEWMKPDLKSLITITMIIVSGILAFQKLQARVERVEEKAGEDRQTLMRIGSRIEEINNTLNDSTYGLPVLNLRLKTLENKK